MTQPTTGANVPPFRLSTTDFVLLVAVAIICVLGVIILTALHDTTPPLLGDLAFGALGAAAGVARASTL